MHSLLIPLLLSTVSALPFDLTPRQDETGCWMEKDSALMQCLGIYASIPPTTPTGNPTKDQARYYCDLYSQLADCWGYGRYCLEWRPMEIEASKFCAMADDSYPEPAYQTLTSVIIEASQVVSSIWHNDVGTAIPVVSDDLGSFPIGTWTSIPKDGRTTIVTENHITPTLINLTPGGPPGEQPPPATAMTTGPSQSTQYVTVTGTRSSSETNPAATPPPRPVVTIGGAASENNNANSAAISLKPALSILAGSLLLISQLL